MLSDIRAIDQASPSTDATDITVSETSVGTTLARMFSVFGTDWARLCLSKERILRYLKENFSSIAKSSGPALFLFMDGDQCVVLRIVLYEDGHYRASCYPIEHDEVWPDTTGSMVRRLVVAKQPN